jgi:hypothetical protein
VVLVHVDIVEIHAAHGCNLNCQSCSHYSNTATAKGLLSLDDALAWTNAWKQRIAPWKFRVLGGEPTLHPELTKIVVLMRQQWPDTLLELTTNGFFLQRHPELPRALAETKTTLIWSIHDDSIIYNEHVVRIRELLKQWQSAYSFMVSAKDSHRGWTRRYHGEGADMLPYSDGRPEKSWGRCPARLAKQLHEGKLWKCPALAYLPLHKRTYPALPPAWDPYLAYEALDPSCSDEELKAFAAKQAETFCGMCPATDEPFKKPSPLRVIT